MWGWAFPLSAATVTVTPANTEGTSVFSGRSSVATNGQWTVLLPPVNVSAETFLIYAEPHAPLDPYPLPRR